MRPNLSPGPGPAPLGHQPPAPRRPAGSRQRQQKQARVRRDAVAAVAVAVVAIAGIVLYIHRQNAVTVPKGTQTYEIPSKDHTTEPVEYPQNPPVGGDHNPVWQNCGYYDEPVRNENAVHSLEHGAVWITYQPDLPQDQ